MSDLFLNAVERGRKYADAAHDCANGGDDVRGYRLNHMRAAHEMFIAMEKLGDKFAYLHAKMNKPFWERASFRELFVLGLLVMSPHYPTIWKTIIGLLP